MLETSQALLVASTFLTLGAFLCYVLGVFAARQAPRARAKVPVAVTATGSEELPDGEAANELDDAPEEPRPSNRRGIVWLGSQLGRVALLLLTASMVVRFFATGNPPFANHYEFAVSFGWGMLLAHVYFEWRYKVRTLALVVLPVIFGMLLYATTLSYEATRLMPALQNSPLLTMHVFCAALAYGAAVVSFGAAVMYLLAPHIRWRGWPKQEILDEVGYKACIVTFPLLTIMIILGAIWANIAWGRYWSWDPKETSALVTWFIYGAYLHARVTRDWRGNRAAWLLVIGFLAILFTYFGNLFFGGMHSYA